MPDRAELVRLLKRWAARHAELSAQLHALVKIVGGDFGAPLFAAAWNAWNDYTETLGRLVGDHEDWLGWFEHENDMGRKGLAVTSTAGRTLKVKTVQQLASLILESRN
jgi:hypothetical protein